MRFWVVWVEICEVLDVLPVEISPVGGFVPLSFERPHKEVSQQTEQYYEHGKKKGGVLTEM